MSGPDERRLAGDSLPVRNQESVSAFLLSQLEDHTAGYDYSGLDNGVENERLFNQAAQDEPRYMSESALVDTGTGFTEQGV